MYMYKTKEEKQRSIEPMKTKGNYNHECETHKCKLHCKCTYKGIMNKTVYSDIMIVQYNARGHRLWGGIHCKVQLYHKLLSIIGKNHYHHIEETEGAGWPLAPNELIHSQLYSVTGGGSGYIHAHMCRY